MSFLVLSESLGRYQDLSIIDVSERTLILNFKGRIYRFSTDEVHDVDWVIFEDWLLERSDIILSKILNKLGLSKKIYARNCEVVKLTQPVADEFLKNNHVFGPAGTKVKIGLLHHSELVAVMTFAAPRKFGDLRSGELVRFCTKVNCSITGGLNKLLNYYLKNYPCDDIFTYIDSRWGSGEGFEKIGFVKEGEKILHGVKMYSYRKVIS
ncbi:MAG: hypothetical protein H6600_08610 [Flavobacteriales bacterium]|nr:hypothetical protein [Flavobacteriales bacterium]MCB9198507.1 hypothetical protein [Flavobacteriales bacterium]